MNKPECAVFYTSDMGYLLPTIISALAVRRQVSPSEADIRIVLTNVPEEVAGRVESYLNRFDIIVGRLAPEAYSNFDETKFNQTHVPVSCLARFFMLDGSPGLYNRVVYLDGDTWVNGDITALINYKPPEGKIAAAEGASYFYRNDYGPTGEWTRNYFRGIGIENRDGYFNSGVLAATAKTWREISDDAFSYFAKNSEACLYHDESALNAVALDRRVRISPRWNFCSPYWDWGTMGAVKPAIFHFAGGVKPWTGRISPFADLYDQYELEIKELGNLSLPRRLLSASQVALANKAARKYRAKINTVFLLRKLTKRADMIRIHGMSEI